MPPFFDSTLKRAQLAIGEDSGMSAWSRAKSVLPMLSGSASSHARTRDHVASKGFGARAPIARRSRREPMGRTNLALLPRRREPCKKAVETARVAGRQMRGVTGGQFREVMLYGTDLFEEL